MPSVPRVIAKTVDLHFRWITAEGQEAENVYQFVSDATPFSTAGLYELAEAFFTRMSPIYRGFMSSQTSIKEVYVRSVVAATGEADATYTPVGPYPGLFNQAALPGNVACSLSLQTGQTGRSKRGAKRISGFPDDGVDRDTIQNWLLAQLANLAVNLLIGYITGSGTFMPAVGSNTLHTSQELQNIAIVNAFSDSQKTRLAGHGN